jgi:hypothetical protein
VPSHIGGLREVCEKLVLEEDPVRFRQLVDEMNRLIEEKEKRLAAASTDKSRVNRPALSFLVHRQSSNRRT